MKHGRRDHGTTHEGDRCLAAPLAPLGPLRHAKAGLFVDAQVVRKNYSGQSFLSYHCVVSSELVVAPPLNAGRHVKTTGTPLSYTWLPNLVHEF